MAFTPLRRDHVVAGIIPVSCAARVIAAAAAARDCCCLSVRLGGRRGRRGRSEGDPCL